MPLSADLKHFLSCLSAAEHIPRPDNEDWPALIARISILGKIADINQETFDYFLEVLPPKFMAGTFSLLRREPSLCASSGTTAECISAVSSAGMRPSNSAHSPASSFPGNPFSRKEIVMDPQATWDQLLSAYAAGDWDEIEERATDLLGWLDRGGFPPQVVTASGLGPEFNRALARAGCLFALEAVQGEWSIQA